MERPTPRYLATSQTDMSDGALSAVGSLACIAASEHLHLIGAATENCAYVVADEAHHRDQNRIGEAISDPDHTKHQTNNQAGISSQSLHTQTPSLPDAYRSTGLLTAQETASAAATMPIRLSDSCGPKSFRGKRPPRRERSRDGEALRLLVDLIQPACPRVSVLRVRAAFQAPRIAQNLISRYGLGGIEQD